MATEAGTTPTGDEEYRQLLSEYYHELQCQRPQGAATGLEEVKLRLFLSLLSAAPKRGSSAGGLNPPGHP